ncbi:MAG: TonB-dependent receptor [Flavobacteriaceae bacterium CG_4_8_14_3_um_filter_34_10]|nr:TonB-dependent receptor [Flavobacteriia bacterium]PIX08108.1 MAG: TonB-dependent receptor [Flavobacteriaceae bacterium CG_4_8_14_3_um_filter_34_10]PJC07512.1 MAG: TonB-dependent receptor [Flavobacteriaceae bacterium CG_4_9_14_0_8_um_filter_34_30]
MRISIFFLFTLSLVQAQNFQIEGQIADVENVPLSFVTVVLLKASDSTFVSGTATRADGHFVFNDIPQGAFVLKGSIIGFEDLFKPIELTRDIDLGDLILRENPEELEDVNLYYQRPTIQREIDRLIFNVENTSLSNGSSMDILKRTPGVIVQQNSITVQNQQATIYINDRKVNISPSDIQSLLEGFAGSNVKSIEVITNPSAKYDADSGMIINIVTSKALTPGYKGSVSGGFEQSIFPKYSAGTSHYFKNEKLNIFVNYNFRKRKEHKNDLSEITFFEPDNSINSFWETDFQRITRSETHTVNSFIDYSLSDNTTLNFSSLVSLNPKTTFSNSEIAEIFSAQRQLDSLFTTKSSLDSEKYNIAFDFSMNHNFNKKGTSLKFNAHYTNFEHTRFQDVNTNYFLPDQTFLRNNTFFTDANQDINIYVGQLDFTTKLLKIPFEMGVKASSINTESGIDFFDYINGEQQFNPILSDNFKYEENVYAGYFSYSKNWEKWKFRAGLRGEYTETTGISVTLAQKSKNNYMDWFPNLILNFIPNQDHSIKVAYKRSIQRPNYSQLNPFSYFINENNFNTGDPDLQSAITDKYSLEYVAENKYTFEFYYRTTQGAVDVLSFQNNENRFLRNVSTNIENNQGVGFDFKYFKFIKDWWSFFHYNSLFYEENSFIAIESNNELVTVSSSGLLFQFINSFTISKDKTFTGDLTVLHLTGLATGNYLMDDFTLVSAGLRKTIWDNRASISLTVNDIFDTFNRKLQSDFLNQRNSFFANTESRYLLVGFIYNFGNFRLKDNAKQIINEERERI